MKNGNEKFAIACKIIPHLEFEIRNYLYLCNQNR